MPWVGGSRRKVFQVDNDVNRFRFFVGVGDEDSQILASLDCTPRASHWVPPRVRIFDEQLKDGALYQFMSHLFIMSPHAVQVLGSYVATAGEFLPLPFGDTTYTLLNVTNCLDCVPPQHVEQAVVADSFIFDAQCLARSRSPLFKVPRFATSRIFVVEGLQEPEHELRAVVDRAGLPGIEFKLVWTE